MTRRQLVVVALVVAVGLAAAFGAGWKWERSSPQARVAIVDRN